MATPPANDPSVFPETLAPGACPPEPASSSSPAPDTDPNATLVPPSDDPYATQNSAQTLPPEAFVDPRWPLVPGYHILGILGRGGMGVVYKARHVGLNRVVALKMIRRAEDADKEGRLRFRLEAEAAARLQHPHIVQVFEVGEHEGAPFMALEFCAGGGLDRKQAGAPLPPREAALMLESVARAVHAAHEAKVIHRDLKPANILLTADGTPKITDFGLAKKLDEVGQTQHGEIVGTPTYMSPEQADGLLEQIGPVSDVWALASILYEMLTGHAAFRAANVWDTLALVRHQEPVPPRQVQPNVPVDLETICLKGMQKLPAKRYGSALEMAEDLRRFLDGRSILGRRTPPWERAWKWARRRPTAAALVGVAALAVLAVVAGTLFYGLYEGLKATALQERLERGQRIDTLLEKGKDAEAAGRIALEKGQTDEAAKLFVLAGEHLDGALAALDTSGGVAQDELRGQIVERRERVRKYAEEQDERRTWRDRLGKFWAEREKVLFHDVGLPGREQAENREQVRRLAPIALRHLTAPAGPTEVSRALLDRRKRFDSPGELSRVAEGCYEVLLVWAEAEATEQPEGARRALGHLETAEALARTHQLETPQAFYARRVRYRLAAGDQAGADADRASAAKQAGRTVLDHFLSAMEAWKQGDVAAASKASEQTLRGQPEHYWAQYLLALCRMKTSRWDEAKIGWTACLSRQGDLGWVRLYRASAHVGLQEYAFAEADFALVLQQASEDPLLRYVALVHRATLWVKQERWDEALTDLNSAIQSRPEAQLAYGNLAQVHMARKDWNAAIKTLDLALKRRQEPALFFTRARAHRERKDLAAARADFEKAIALEPPGSKSEQLLSSLVELGYLKHLDGDYPVAMADFDRALSLQRDYAPAHRQRAETLLKLDRQAEAGRALDRFLRTGQPDHTIYLARGLIHTKLGEHRAAVEAYTAALRFEDNAATYGYRGWAYLQTEAPRRALEDFEAALEMEESPTYQVLCGRGMALVRLGKVEDAVKDAESALRIGKGAEPALLASCIYARAATLLEVQAERLGKRNKLAQKYDERAVELLAQALQQVPAKQQGAFWKTRVEKEPALEGVRRNVKIRKLTSRFER